MDRVAEHGGATVNRNLNIIEQAAKRLEELQRAGVEVPWSAAATGQIRVPAVISADSPSEVGAESSTVAPLPTVAQPESVAEVARETPPARALQQVTIDLARLQSEGYAVPGAVRGLLADELRVLKRPLLKNATLSGAAAVKRGKFIQLTSALPGEGKTFTAINLALSLSMELDHSVLLVDADVLRPAVLPRLGLKADRGLMDLLRDPALALDEVVLQTNLPKLTLLPPGAAGSNSTELLASSAMEALLDRLMADEPERLVIFDAPPVLAATEARVLATRVGQVVMVVGAGSTHRDVVMEALDALAGCAVVLPVLNKYTGPQTASPYGY